MSRPSGTRYQFNIGEWAIHYYAYVTGFNRRFQVDPTRVVQIGVSRGEEKFKITEFFGTYRFDTPWGSENFDTSDKVDTALQSFGAPTLHEIDEEIEKRERTENEDPMGPLSAYESKGEYYAELDDDTGLWCVFHTDKGDGKAYHSYASREEAEKKAKEMNANMSEGRDDVWKLPLPRAAKLYARRHGLRSMMRQPKDFVKVNAMLTNPGRPNKWKNYEVGADTTGKKGAPKSAIKASIERQAYVDRTSTQLLEALLEAYA